MPSTSTTGAGENAPKNGIAVVAEAAITSQPSAVLRRRYSAALRVRYRMKMIAKPDAAIAISRSDSATGSPCNPSSENPDDHDHERDVAEPPGAPDLVALE